MKKINKILVPTDFSPSSENAFQYALRLADQHEASIELLHILYPEVAAADFPIMVVQNTQERIEMAKEVAQTFVKTSITKLKTNQQLHFEPRVHTEIQFGSTIRLIGFAAEKMDLIVMGTRSEHSTLEKIFGSTTTEVIRQTSKPILVIPENAPFNTVSNIIYATELTEKDPYLIQKAANILKAEGALMRVLHIHEGEVEKTEIEMEELKLFFKKPSGFLKATFHQLFGLGIDISSDLDKFTKAWDGDVLVMYAPARNFFERLFHKSLTKETALYCEIPLLVLK